MPLHGSVVVGPLQLVAAYFAQPPVFMYLQHTVPARASPTVNSSVSSPLAHACLSLHTRLLCVMLSACRTEHIRSHLQPGVASQPAISFAQSPPVLGTFVTSLPLMSMPCLNSQPLGGRLNFTQPAYIRRRETSSRCGLIDCN